MECYRCGTVVDGEDFCPNCGADIGLYRRILAAADACYNDGLEKAQVRDLSGAVESLNRCLSYYKYHTQARNLLGLVYFELGEIVMALSEWVISKNLQPENPLADRYLEEIQKSPGMLDKMNQTIKKYNQALVYCHQDSRDLATIKLRKVLSLNPKFVAGRQLLALLYIQDGKYDEAMKSLQAANKIDVKNTRTLRYMNEVREQQALQQKNQKKKKKRKDDAVSFKDGNDTVVMPQNSFRDLLDNTRASIVNILVGLVVGLLICFFLVVPTVREQARSDAANALVDANEELTNSSANVESLQKQVEQLQSELANYTGKADAVNSYELLMQAQEANGNGDLEAAATALGTVNRDLLGDRGKAVYDTIQTAINARTLEENEETGRRAFRRGNYEEAIAAYLVVVGIDENYRDGQVLYNLAESYREIGDNANARTYYDKVIAAFPDSSYARNAQNRLDEITEAEQAAGATGTQEGQTAQQGQTTQQGQTARQ